MNYLKRIIRQVIDGAGDPPRAKLQFLRQRLETCPEAMSAEIIDFKK
jgi:hypothetical protein